MFNFHSPVSLFSVSSELQYYTVLCSLIQVESKVGSTELLWYAALGTGIGSHGSPTRCGILRAILRKEEILFCLSGSVECSVYCLLFADGNTDLLCSSSIRGGTPVYDTRSRTRKVAKLRPTVPYVLLYSSERDTSAQAS